MDIKLLRDEMSSFTSSEHVDEYLNFYGIDFKQQGLARKQVIGIVKSNNETLVAQAFYSRNARANALVNHGYLDHTGLYGPLIRHLLMHRFNVFMIDLPGHGLSSGPRASIDSFFDYSDALHTFLDDALPTARGLPLYMFGQSMGGANAMTLHMLGQYEFEKTVLLAPLIRPLGWPLLKQAHSMLKPIIPSIPRTFHGNTHNPEFNEFLEFHDSLQAKSIPIEWINAMREWKSWLLSQDTNDANILMLQGTADPTVDRHYSQKKIPEMFPNVDIQIVQGARHHMINESSPYIDIIFNAIDEFIDVDTIPKKRRFRFV